MGLVTEVGSVGESELTLLNRGEGALEISHIELRTASSEALVVRFEWLALPVVLAPHEVVRLPVRFTPRNEGELIAMLEIESNDPLAPLQRARVIGRALPAPCCEPKAPPACTTEVCGNAVDDDCDGIADEDCLPPELALGAIEVPPPPEGVCLSAPIPRPDACRYLPAAARAPVIRSR